LKTTLRSRSPGVEVIEKGWNCSWVSPGLKVTIADEPSSSTENGCRSLAIASE
jgi:hypothetical protein